MLIELDLDEAKRLKITVNQFILIKLIIEKIDIKSLINVVRIDESDIVNLKEQGILTSESSLNLEAESNLVVTEEFIKKFKAKDFFDEFFDIYPTSTIRPDGLKDYLRGDVSRCRKYYSKIVGKSRAKHERMIESLKFELATRKQSNGMQYMKRMPKWLLSEEWLLYEEFIKDKTVIKQAEEVYGTGIE